MSQTGFALLTSLALILAFSSAHGEEKKVVRFEISVDRNSEIGREVISIYQNIFKKYGYEFQAEDFPPMRGVEELKRGKIDGTAGRIGNIVSLFDVHDFVRVDYPIMFLTFSLWCNRPLTQYAESKKIKLGYYRGSIASTQIASHSDGSIVKLQVLNNYKMAISMLKKGRLDCMIGSEAIMDSEGNNLAEMQGFHRHNILTSPVYPWISKKLAHLKVPLEKDLAVYAFSDLWEKRYKFEKANCQGGYDWLCPDGIIFKTGIKIAQ